MRRLALNSKPLHVLADSARPQGFPPCPSLRLQICSLKSPPLRFCLMQKFPLGSLSCLIFSWGTPFFSFLRCLFCLISGRVSVSPQPLRISKLVFLAMISVPYFHFLIALFSSINCHLQLNDTLSQCQPQFWVQGQGLDEGFDPLPYFRAYVPVLSCQLFSLRSTIPSFQFVQLRGAHMPPCPPHLP